MKMRDLADLMTAIKTVTPPTSLRAGIRSSIVSLAPTPILAQLRVATVLSVCLFMVTFSGYLISAGQNNPVSVLDLTPTSFVESVVLGSNELSSDVILNTLIESY